MNWTSGNSELDWWKILEIPLPLGLGGKLWKGFFTHESRDEVEILEMLTVESE
jgi:hypothetical protein